jgi:long-subunit fatty acid transport protein
MDIGDGISAGIWYTNNGNGVSLDYGTLTAPFTGDTGTIAADLNMPSLAALVTYDINDNFSLIGGFKRVTVPGGASVKTFNNTDNDNTLGADTGIGGAEDLPDATSTWTLSDTSAAGAVYGLSYARSDIALRVTLLVEEAIGLSIDTTGAGAIAANGTSTASVGDAISIAFQTGIAENTLLYGNYRISKWKDNQVSVPTVAGLAQLSDFDDGDSWSLGVARRINDSLAVSVSYFSDPGDGDDASELSPTGGNRAITAGAKVGVMDNADLTLGATWSQRGDATTANLGAELNKSIVTTLGAKLSYKF